MKEELLQEALEWIFETKRWCQVCMCGNMNPCKNRGNVISNPSAPACGKAPFCCEKDCNKNCKYDEQKVIDLYLNSQKTK